MLKFLLRLCLGPSITQEVKSGIQDYWTLHVFLVDNDPIPDMTFIDSSATGTVPKPDVSWLHRMTLLFMLVLAVTLSSEMKQLAFSTRRLRAAIAPALQVPKVPRVANWLWRKMISLDVLGQLKALPLQSVFPPPIIVQVNVSTSPEQAHWAFLGTTSSFVAIIRLESEVVIHRYDIRCTNSKIQCWTQQFDILSCACGWLCMCVVIHYPRVH